MKTEAPIEVPFSPGFISMLWVSISVSLTEARIGASFPGLRSNTHIQALTHHNVKSQDFSEHRLHCGCLTSHRKRNS